MKRTAIAVAAALGIAAGGTGNAAAAEIALVVSTLNNPFFVTLQEGAQAQAKELGHELTVLDSRDDPARELSNVEDAVIQGVDALLVNPTDSNAVASAVRAANARDIPVITLDRAANRGDVVAHVASDNVEGGRLAGDYVIDQLDGDGEVVQLEGVPGASATRDRGKGFMEAISDAGGIELVASQPAEFNRTKGMNVMENLLQAHDDIDAVFAQNDEMALGAVRAIEASGRDIMVVGFDGTDDGVAAVEDGSMAATVAQQAGRIGELGVTTADRVLAGDNVEDYIPVPLKLVTE
ncbi:ribose ABC transporter substrate-binding protein RbsB [Arhodomonas sp. AD133]|uniref:ribose ABC transporter substrate-binding protein RbsB n=1 Tax=Arhodomonas sp. AD133 TaxID=3415009 RepID=UPI003EBB457F